MLSLDEPDRYYLKASVLLSALAAAVFVAFLILSGFPKPTLSPDGPGYVSVTEHLKGSDVELNKFRISRPIVPLLALPLSYVVDTPVSFIVNNAVFFVLLAGMFYILARDLTGKAERAFQAVLLLIFAFPVYYRGINVTVDLVSWLFFVCMGWAVLYCTERELLTLKTASVMAVVCAIGTLVSELVLASFLLVFLQYFLINFRKKTVLSVFGGLFVIGASFTLVFLIIQSGIYLIFDYSFFDKAAHQQEWVDSHPTNNGVMGLLRVMIGGFNVSLFFLPLGILDYLKDRRHDDLHLAMLAAILLTLLAVYTNSIRFVFVLFPLVFTFAVRGVSFLASRLGAAVSGSESRTRLVEAVLIAGICACNILLYAGFVRYGSTIKMARHFLSFLL